MEEAGDAIKEELNLPDAPNVELPEVFGPEQIAPEDLRDSWLDILEDYRGKTDAEVTVNEAELPGAHSQISSVPIPEDEVIQVIQMNISEFHPFLGLTTTMSNGELVPDSQHWKILSIRSSQYERYCAQADAVMFLLDWLYNSSQVTLLRAKIAADGRMNVEYGSALELNYSGKHVSLSEILVDRLYNVNPLIIFTSGEEADTRIRDWFHLDGDGRYSMTLNFGRVNIGDCGYRLYIEDGVMYQVPILHEDTEFNVFFKEEGKTILDASTYLFDAADIMRDTAMELSPEETEKVMAKLREHGLID